MKGWPWPDSELHGSAMGARWRGQREGGRSRGMGEAAASCGELEWREGCCQGRRLLR
jgi:hypothetical protein